MKTRIASAISALALAGCGGSSDGPATNQPVVMMGDSITYYWDDTAWQTDQSVLISKHIKNVIDAGVHGETCSQMLARFDTDVLAQRPAVVVIECGTNDIGQNQSTDLTPLFTMVQKAQSAGAQVIVGNLPPNAFWAYIIVHDDMPLFAYWREQILSNASVYGYQVANYTPAMELPDGDLNPALFVSDNTHPDSAGYAVMWNVLKPLIPVSYRVEQ